MSRLARRLAASETETARQLYAELGEEYTTEDERVLWWCRLAL
jgi:hypothetical protein